MTTDPQSPSQPEEIEQLQEWFSQELWPILRQAVRKISSRFATPLFDFDDHLQNIALMTWQLLLRGTLSPDFTAKGCVAYMYRRASDQVWKSRLNHGISGIKFNRTSRELAEQLSCWYIFSSSLDFDSDQNPALTEHFDLGARVNQSDAKYAADRILGLLQGREAVILRMAMMDGASMKEIGVKLNISESTVGTIKRNAVQNLNKIISSSCARRLHKMIQEIVAGD